jgi:putative transposase
MGNVRHDPGAPVSYAGKNWRVLHALDFERVVLEDSSGNERVTAPVSELRPEIALERAPAPSTLLPDVTEEDWAEARRRYSLIKPLLIVGGCTKAEVRTRALECKVGVRTLYRFLNKFNQTRQISVLLPRRSRGAKGKGRLTPEIERLVSEVVELYLKKQRFTKRDVWIEVVLRCKARGFKSPSQSAVARRINWLKPLLVIRRQSGQTIRISPWPVRPSTLSSRRRTD